MYDVIAFLISLLPLTPSTTTSESLVSHLGSVSVVLFRLSSECSLLVQVLRIISLLSC